MPNPGTVAERQVMSASQPGFLDACRAGVQRARDASCADGAGNAGHTAVRHWGRFTVLGLHVNMRRTLDPMTTSLERKLQEVDLVDAFAWWLVQHVGVNSETAWSYVCTVNAWHDRSFGIGLAGGMSLQRVKGMIEGWQRLQGAPVARRVRYGVRPRRLRDAISRMRPGSDPLHANVAACMEVALVALARMGELVPGRGAWSALIQPSRADVDFDFDAAGVLRGCTIHICNIKARGAERFRRLPVYLPASGRYLSPARSLWFLVYVIDPVPDVLRASTPLFRDPSGRVLSVASIRMWLRFGLVGIGLDASLYGAHSLRIGGATAMAFLGAPREVIMAAGRWRSDAYLRYVRSARGEATRYAAGVAGADTDDFESDFVAIDEFDFDDTDVE